jgi:hypothetical protein
MISSLFICSQDRSPHGARTLDEEKGAILGRDRPPGKMNLSLLGGHPLGTSTGPGH